MVAVAVPVSLKCGRCSEFVLLSFLDSVIDSQVQQGKEG